MTCALHSSVVVCGREDDDSPPKSQGELARVPPRCDAHAGAPGGVGSTMGGKPRCRSVVVELLAALAIRYSVQASCRRGEQQVWLSLLLRSYVCMYAGGYVQPRERLGSSVAVSE